MIDAVWDAHREELESATMDDRELMGLRADTLFTYDARGRMVRSNEPQGRPAPRLFVGCTVSGTVVRFGEAVPDALVCRLAEIIESQSLIGTLQMPPAVLTAVRETLEQHAPVRGEGGGPAYRFPGVLVPSSEVVQVTDANVELACDTYPWLLEELADWWPCFAVLCEGAAVSVCFSSRIGAAAAEAGVDTLPAFRGRGYAATVTAAWGASVRGTGRIPLYSTSWDNVASQAVARRIGLIMFGVDATWV
jgi:GNAT acetyltransferase